MRYKNIIIPILLVFIHSSLLADEADEIKWEMYQFKVYFENDLFSQTDSQYSSGEKFNILYHIKESPSDIHNILASSDAKSNIFINFAIGNQLYTPEDLTQTQLIIDDRPYAGWTYFEAGIHKSTKDSLNSILVKIGMVGPSSKGEEIQTGIHLLTDSAPPMGWDNQIGDELGINLTYAYKLRYTNETQGGFQSAYIPYVELDLGNISTQATLGLFTRFGWNIAKDFGLATLDLGGEAGIPVYDEQALSLEKDWSFSFNFTATGSAIAKDIFLDGNTFKDSHSIPKNNFVAYAGAGISLRYKSFNFDFMQMVNTHKADKEGDRKVVGTVIATWMF